jgi:hypothetical protein
MMMTRNQVEALILKDGVLSAGRTLFDLVSVADRPAWSGRVLHVAMTAVAHVPTSVSNVVQLAEGRSSQWTLGHRAFHAVRTETMSVDAKKYRGPGLTSEEERLHHLLAVAELVAKVVYNCTGPSDSFDEDSGWNLLSSARRLATQVGEPEFEDRLWLALLQLKGSG